jgi:hypothetical protein
MHDQDFLDPSDAALQNLLASVAERTGDPARKERLLDYLMTIPPLAEWSVDELEELVEIVPLSFI